MLIRDSKLRVRCPWLSTWLNSPDSRDDIDAFDAAKQLL